MQNLRARPYDPANGRFIGLDPFTGNMQDPQSLHKYAYVHGDPVQGVDPTGLAFIDDLSTQGIVAHIAFSLLVQLIRPNAETGLTLGTQFPSLAGTIYGLLKPDVVDHASHEYFELKPVRHRFRPDLQQLDAAQMIGYDFILGTGFGYQRGSSPNLLAQMPIGGIAPIIIYTSAGPHVLKFYPAEDPMSGGFRGDGLIWYALEPLRRPPTFQPRPELVTEKVYEGERIRVEVWHPRLRPVFSSEYLPEPSTVAVASVLTLLVVAAVAVAGMNARMGSA